MIRVLTRGSALARAQTKIYINMLKKHRPDLEFKVIPVKVEADTTTGPLEGKRAFVRTLEESLQNGFADFAVHSLKDLSVRPIEGLAIAGCLERYEPRDVFVSHDYSDLASLPTGSLVGTSSHRRAAQLAVRYPSIRVLPCRGNVDTRLEKLNRGEFTGLILAGAGMERLGLSHLISEYISMDVMIPTAGQGVIVAQCRSTDTDMRSLLYTVNHRITSDMVQLERRIVELLGADCTSPLGVYVQFIDEGIAVVSVMLSYEDGDQFIQESRQIEWENPEEMEVQLQLFVKYLLERGAAEILEYHSSLES